MIKLMRIAHCAAFLITVLIIGSAVFAADIEIYRGDDPQAKGIIINGIATGEISAASDAVLDGTRSLKLVSKGKYQGGSITFPVPIDVGAAVGEPTSLFSISFLIPENSQPSTDKQGRTARFLRVILATDDNKRFELMLGLTGKRMEGGWTSVGVPFTAFSKFADSTKKIKQIQLSTDYPATLYIGKIAVTTDQTPITVEAFANEGTKEISIANNDVALLWANAEAGASIIKYSWDFDDKDGFQEESEGRVIEHTFRKPGEYIVTVRASDKYGTKKDATATIHVHVAP